MALDFTGSTDNVNYGSASQFDDVSVGTIMAWVRPTDFSSDAHIQAILTKNRLPFRFYVDDFNGSLRFSIGKSGPNNVIAAVESTLAGWGINRWLFAAVVFEFDNMAQSRLYSGNLGIIALEATSYSARTNGSGSRSGDASFDLQVGNAADTQGNFLDEIAYIHYVVGRKLTLPEIQEEQFHPHPVPGTQILSIFDEGGRLVTDLSGNNNHGLITGATYVPADLGPVTFRDDLRPLPIRRKLFNAAPAAVFTGELHNPIFRVKPRGYGHLREAR